MSSSEYCGPSRVCESCAWGIWFEVRLELNHFSKVDRGLVETMREHARLDHEHHALYGNRGAHLGSVSPATLLEWKLDFDQISRPWTALPQQDKTVIHELVIS